MAWSLTYGFVTVTLAFVTSQNEGGDTDIDKFEQDADRPKLTSKAPTETTFSISGALTESTGALLISNYIAPLRAMRSKIVTIVSPYAEFDGDWIFKSFSFSRTGPCSIHKRNFTLTFVQGSDMDNL
jgi:hypothetical protein